MKNFLRGKMKGLDILLGEKYKGCIFEKTQWQKMEKIASMYVPCLILLGHFVKTFLLMTIKYQGKM